QSLILPDDVNADAIEAKMENGILNVHLPKLQKIDKPESVKQITVK
nr:Hsp20/alpha crystallin family protein [Bacteroidales bacterium]